MKSRKIFFMLVSGAVACAVMMASSAFSDNLQPRVRGQHIFSQKCSLCHDDSQHMINDNGPALFGVVGRQVGSVDGYTYSPVLQAARARGDVWTRSRLNTFLAGPESLYAGTGMPMHFETAQDRLAIIAYLKTLKTKE